MNSYFLVAAITLFAAGVTFVFWLGRFLEGQAERNEFDPGDAPFCFIPLVLLIIFGAYAILGAGVE